MSSVRLFFYDPLLTCVNLLNNNPFVVPFVAILRPIARNGAIDIFRQPVNHKHIAFLRMWIISYHFVGKWKLLEQWHLAICQYVLRNVVLDKQKRTSSLGPFVIVTETIRLAIM